VDDRPSRRTTNTSTIHHRPQKTSSPKNPAGESRFAGRLIEAPQPIQPIERFFSLQASSDYDCLKNMYLLRKNN
jgi:hypothetical protein